MKVDLLAADDPRWGTVLAAGPHDFYHLPGYVRLAARQIGGEPYAVYAEDAGRTLLVPVILRPIPGGGIDGSSPYGYPGPLVRPVEDAAFASEALRAALEMLADRGVVSIMVRSHPLLGDLPIDGLGTAVRHGNTVSVDLTQPTEVLWGQTRSGHRDQIKRAIRDGHRVWMDVGLEHFDTFKALYRDTMTRVNAEPYYHFDDDYFRGLREALGERLHLAVVEIDGSIAAAALFVETFGIVQYHLSGSDHRFAAAGPTKLLLHFVRNWAKDRGDRWFHLGGGLGGPADPLLRFKAGFSPIQHEFHTFRFVLRPDEYRRLVASRAPGADPLDLSGYFPAYRREAQKS